MAKIQIYTQSRCPFCVCAKELFGRRNVNFDEINLDDKPLERKALQEKTGMRTVPQIFINDQLIGGYMELAELESSGELCELLGPAR